MSLSVYQPVMQLTSKYNNTSSVTNMLEDVGLCKLEQCRIDSWLTTLFKITWGLLSVNSNGLLHPVTRRTCHSDQKSFIPFKLACPLSIYIFLKNNGTINLPASVLREHCSLDTFKAHVSCLNHLPVYNPIKSTFFLFL